MKFRLKFNSFERAVGFLIVFCTSTFFLVLISLAIKQAWFQDSVVFHTYYNVAEGLNPGTTVLVGGVKAGVVEQVEIEEDNRIQVFFKVKRKFAERIRKDSVAQIIRPFVIGEKQINVTLGNSGTPYLAAGGLLNGEESMELTDLLSGHRLIPYLKVIETAFRYANSLMEQLDASQEKFDLIGISRELLPTLRSARDAFARVQFLQQQLQTLASDFQAVRKDFLLTPDMKGLVKNTSRATSEFASLGQSLNQLQPQIHQTLQDLASITPELARASPELLKLTKETTKTLAEMQLVLKAMQRSWFFKGHVKDIVREEIEKIRTPAAEAEPAPKAPALKSPKN